MPAATRGAATAHNSESLTARLEIAPPACVRRETVMIKKFPVCFAASFGFSRKPLNLWSRLLLLAAAVAIVASLFFPLWKMHLVAPQYSDGLDLYIYTYKIAGRRT